MRKLPTMAIMTITTRIIRPRTKAVAMIGMSMVICRTLLSVSWLSVSAFFTYFFRRGYSFYIIDKRTIK